MFINFSLILLLNNISKMTHNFILFLDTEDASEAESEARNRNLDEPVEIKEQCVLTYHNYDLFIHKYQFFILGCTKINWQI